ncbi:MAG: 2Fe-2S iron-sulfur cluster-binding protein [Methylococcaceae bacterium]
MPTITFGTDTFVSQADETVLDTLLRENQPIPYSCKQGICQSCLMRCMDKTPPATAQAHLKDTLVQQNYFLSCVCVPQEDMTVALFNAQNHTISASVQHKSLLAPDIMRLVLRYDLPFDFFAGQFVNLQRADGLTRSYSIANTPHIEQRVEFHIRRLPNGQFSNWVFDECLVGDTLGLSQALGSCFYLAGFPEQPLLLIGTGSGLAPLYGIIQDALAQQHSGPIHLFHGSRHREGLYLIDELRQLAEQFANFSYTACVSGDSEAEDVQRGRVHDIAFNHLKQLKGWRVYLCGHPDMVKDSKKTAYLKGASLRDIYSDEFVVDSATRR